MPFFSFHGRGLFHKPGRKGTLNIHMCLENLKQFPTTDEHLSIAVFHAVYKFWKYLYE